MKPIVLLSNFLGGVTVPHWLTRKDIGEGFINANVIYDKDSPLNKGDNVTFTDLHTNALVYEIISKNGDRKARGEWSFRKSHPNFCQIETKHVGYYDVANESVSKERITTKQNS